MDESCKCCFPTQHEPLAGSLAGAGDSRALIAGSESTSLGPSPKQASCNSPASTANTEVAAAHTPTEGACSSADSVLTAPDTQGKQQVMERIHLTSPSKMLAASTIAKPPASCSPAAGLHLPGQVSTSSGHNPVADTLQLTTAPAVHGSPDALHASFTSAASWKGAPVSGLLGVRCADGPTDLADWPGEQTPAGILMSPAHLGQQDSTGNAGTTLH